MPLQNRVDPFGELFADARARPVHGQSRRAHSHRRPNADQAALGVAAVDLLRARLQEPPARRLGPLLHRAVLPRRGDRARRRAPALLRMPAQGCRSFRRLLAARRSSCRRGRAPTKWTWSCTPNGSTAAPSACTAARSTICPMARSSRWSEGAFAVRGNALLRWTPRGYDARKRRVLARDSRRCADAARDPRRCSRPATGRTGIPSADDVITSSPP